MTELEKTIEKFQGNYFKNLRNKILVNYVLKSDEMYYKILGHKDDDEDEKNAKIYLSPEEYKDYKDLRKLLIK